MKKTIWFCFSVFMFFSIQAQQHLQDSLIEILNTQQLTAKEQLDLYERISSEYSNNNLEGMLEYAQKGLQLSEKEKEKEMSIRFLSFIGKYNGAKAKFDSARVFYNKALIIAKEINDVNYEASLYNNIARSYTHQDNYATGISYYQKALSLYESINKKDMMALVLANIGGNYRGLGEYNVALRYLEKAKELAEEVNDMNSLSKTYMDLGNLYVELKKYDKALEYEEKAIELAKQINRIPFQAAAYQTVAFIYLELEEYEKAEKAANECLRLAKEFDEEALIQIAWNILANVYIGQGRYKETEEAAMKAWAIDSTGHLATNISINLAYANIYLGNKDKAVAYLSKYANLIREFSNENFHQTLSELEVKYETEKKEIRIAALEKDRKLYLGLGFAGIVVLLLAFGLLFYRHRLNIQKRKLVEQQHRFAEKEIKQLQQEKQLIATQAILDGEAAERARLARDLHDGLGGMLSVLKLNLNETRKKNREIIADNNFEMSLEILDQTIIELRRVAHHMMPESLMRNGLKVSLEDFCRSIPGAFFQYIGTDNRLDSRLEILIYHCAYELINNAVKHANATQINIQLILDERLISLTVQDNGCGFDPESGTQGNGFSNIQTRISAYDGKMVVYSSPGNGTEITIEIEC